MADQADNGETDPAAPGQPLASPMPAQSWASQLQQESEALQSLKAGSPQANERSEAFLKRLDAQLATLLGKESAAWPEQFRGLAADEQGLTLATLVFAGNAEGLRSGQPDPLRRRLDRYNLAIALGTGSEPGAALPAELGPWRAVFTALAADAQGSVLKALVNAGVTEGQRSDQPDPLRRQLDRYKLAIALGTGSEPGAALPAELGPWREIFFRLFSRAPITFSSGAGNRRTVW